MNFVSHEIHDSLCATFQTVELARLNDVLKSAGISDQSLRRRICETYFFNSGYFVDACWIGEEERRFRPGLYFAEVDRDGQDLERAYVPDPSIGTMLHEYAHGAAAWLFDDHNEDASEIPTGDILLEDA
jgi:hypothetical protein